MRGEKKGSTPYCDVVQDQEVHVREGGSPHASCTIGEIGRLAAQRPDVRRFRPNILISSLRSVPFEEDEWVGGVLSFGDTNEAATVGITNHDERCSMVNF